VSAYKVLGLFPPPSPHSPEFSSFCRLPTEHDGTGFDGYWLYRHATAPWGMPALLFLTGLGQLIYATSAGSRQAYLGRAF
jgi:hypothetical protein